MITHNHYDYRYLLQDDLIAPSKIAMTDQHHPWNSTLCLGLALIIEFLNDTSGTNFCQIQSFSLNLSKLLLVITD